MIQLPSSFVNQIQLMNSFAMYINTGDIAGLHTLINTVCASGCLLHIFKLDEVEIELTKIKVSQLYEADLESLRSTLRTSF